MDVRRASMTGRGGGIAGSSTGGSSYGSGPGSLDWVVGLRVRVNTILDDVYEGTVFAYDPTTYTVALCHAATSNGNTSAASTTTTYNPPLSDYRILKLSFLKDVQVVATPPKQTNTGPVSGGAFANAEPKIGPVNLQNVLEREKTAVRLEAERSLTRGVGVTKEAQEIFDGINRLLKCEWQGKTIVVMGMVLVTEPYTLENVKATAGQAVNPQMIQQVKKMLEGERKRIFGITKKNATPSSTPTPTANTASNNSVPTSSSTTPIPAVPPLGERKGG